MPDRNSPDRNGPHRGNADEPLCRLAEQARDGDRAALAELLRGLQDPIWRFCRGQLGDQHEAEEATQETAMRLVNGVQKFAGRSTARTWALGVALNVCRERRRKRPPTAGLDDAPEPTDPTPSPAERAVAAERSTTARSLLAALPDRQREAVALRYFEQLTIDQTAAAMRCSPGTVKATLWQALRRLRDSLKTEVEETCG